MAVNLEKFIREVPDFPKQGIGFKDITTLLKDAEGFKLAVDQLSEQLKDVKIDAIAVVESRGFPFGSALAYKLGTGLLLVRKPGKLPAKTIRQERPWRWHNWWRNSRERWPPSLLWWSWIS